MVPAQAGQRPVATGGQVVTASLAGPEDGPLSHGASVTGSAAVLAGWRVAGGDRQPCAGAHGRGDVPVPGSVLSDLVVV